jgi:bis(5'-nucleosidyl)-tetraphosphatase
MKDQSFGVIPIRKHGARFLFLLIQHHAGHWAFPKGHAEPGETDEQAALRELREETGIANPRLVEGASFVETYTYRRDGQPVAKTVRYFMGLVESAVVRIQAAEIRAYRWVDYDEALTLVTFSESRRLLVGARDYLERNRQRLEEMSDFSKKSDI